MKEHFSRESRALENNLATKKALGFANIAQEQIDTNKESNKMLATKLLANNSRMKKMENQILVLNTNNIDQANTAKENTYSHSHKDRQLEAMNRFILQMTWADIQKL